MKNFRKFKGSSRKILFESSIYMHPFFIYSYCESNRNTIDRKYRYSIRNELISFHACLEKKKSSKIGTSLSNVENFIRATSFPSIFIFIYTLYFRKGQNRNINRNFFTHHTTIHLEFYFPYFSSNFFFLSFFIPSSRSCATLKYDRLRFIKRYALPPPEKNPSRRGCSLINNPLSVFFSFFFRSFYRPRAKFSPPRLSFYPSFFFLSSSRRHRKETHATSWRINAKHRTD